METAKTPRTKGQSSTEYVISYGWVLLLIAIIGTVTFIYLSATTSIFSMNGVSIQPLVNYSSSSAGISLQHTIFTGSDPTPGASPYVWSSWSGAYSGTNPECGNLPENIPITSDLNVVANFALSTSSIPPTAINGVCESAPDGCISGTPTSESTINGGNVALWTCAGSNGGTSAQCGLALYGVCDPETPVCSQYPACYDGLETNYVESFPNGGGNLPVFSWDCSGYYNTVSCNFAPYMNEQCVENDSLNDYP
jgi:uncharacterized protein (UPF0333 family)